MDAVIGLSGALGSPLSYMPTLGHLGMSVQTIFDLGFHEGGDTDFYLRKGFRVVAVEAYPS